MLTDEDLYEQLRCGSAAAFTILYSRYEQRLFGFISGYVKRREDAEEIFHEVLSAMLVHARTGASGSQPQHLQAWLYTLARNRALNWQRQQKTSASLYATYGREYAPNADNAADFNDDSGDAKRQEALKTAIKALPPRLSDIYQLRSEGRSYEEIALQLHLPLGTVRSRINALMQKLKKDLSLWTV